MSAGDMMRTVHVIVTEEDGIRLAQSIEFDVVSQGESEEEAVRNRLEACRIYLDELGRLPEWRTVEVQVSA